MVDKILEYMNIMSFFKTRKKYNDNTKYLSNTSSFYAALSESKAETY